MNKYESEWPNLSVHAAQVVEDMDALDSDFLM